MKRREVNGRNSVSNIYRKIVFFLLSALIFLTFFAAGTACWVFLIRPKIYSNNSLVDGGESTEKVNSIIEIQNELSSAAGVVTARNNYSNDEVISAMNEEISNFETDEQKRVAELRKIYLLTEGGFYDDALVELDTIKSAYPGIDETCEFNIRGMNLASYKNDKSAQDYYQKHIEAYCGDMEYVE